MSEHQLSDRERQVLDAVIQMYVETAEPAGSRSLAKRFRLGVSAATIRNTMSDLEESGYLYHPHTSAGRIPTDLAYRSYVNELMETPRTPLSEEAVLTRTLGERDPTEIEGLLAKAAQVLGVVTNELGLAVSPSFDTAILDELKLLSVAAEDRLLMVLVLRNAVARTIFVDISSHLPQEAVDKVALVLNERLHGLTLYEIRATLADRLRDSGSSRGERQLMNIFVEEADQIFAMPASTAETVVLGSAQMLADQPEFSSNERMRALLALTERRDMLKDALRARMQGGLTISIGGENTDPRLNGLTVVTSTYSAKGLRGVIGVMGPTRMPYKKVIALVEHTSRLIEELL